MAVHDSITHSSDLPINPSIHSNPLSEHDHMGSQMETSPPSSQSPFLPQSHASYSNYDESVQHSQTSPSLGPISPPLNREASPTLTGTQPQFYRNNSPDRNGGYPELADNGMGDKEAYVVTEPAPSYQHSSAYYSGIPDNQQPQPPPAKKRICGMSKTICLIVVIILLLLVVGLAVGLGVGLTRSKGSKKKDESMVNSRQLIGGVIDPAYYTTSGAFNGSGVAIASVNFGIDASIYFFYQKHSGEIEQLIYHPNGEWDFVTTVATDALNATSLSAVAYIVDTVATWHLFYFNEDRQLKQRIQNNQSLYQTNIWEDGPLNDLNIKGNDAEIIGMQACYWGNYYDSNIVNGSTRSRSTPRTGINLWYGSDDTTITQYDWTHGDAQWNLSVTWPNMNPHAGIGCQSWLSGTTSYVFLVDLNNTLTVYWKDFDSNKSSTVEHPVNLWVNSSVVIPNVHPASSLGYTDFMLYQANDSTIRGVNISWAAENTTIAPSYKGTGFMGTGLDEWSTDPVDAGLGGTHMCITGLDNPSGGRGDVIFYQYKGDGFRLGRRDIFEGAFTYTDVPLLNGTGG